MERHRDGENDKTEPSPDARRDRRPGGV